MFHPTMRGAEISMLSPIIDEKTAERKSDKTRVYRLGRQKHSRLTRLILHDRFQFLRMESVTLFPRILVFHHIADELCRFAKHAPDLSSTPVKILPRQKAFWLFEVGKLSQIGRASCRERV